MNFKYSFYNTVAGPVDSINGNDRSILFSSRTGEAIVINSSIIQEIKDNDFSNLTIPLFTRLIEMESIVLEEEDELQYLTQRSVSAIKDNKTLHYTLQPSAQCQLGCGYCGQSHAKSYLNPKHYEKIIERIEDRLQKGFYNMLDIAWFGAEPLTGLQHIRKLGKMLMALADKYGVLYNSRIITNGLSLKKELYFELLDQYKIELFEITLDGDADSHDKRRNTKSGKETFDIIFHNILSIVNSPDYQPSKGIISIRCNADKSNYRGVSALIDLLAKHGLQDKVSFYIAEIHSWGNDAHLMVDKQEFADKEIEWFMELYEKGFQFHVLPKPKPIVCNSVIADSEIIDPSGNIYNCSEVPLVPFYDNTNQLLGKVTDDVTYDRTKKPFVNWHEEIPINDTWCKGCKMLPLCAGTCPKSWNEKIPPCPSYKFNIEDRLVLSFINSKSVFKEVINSVYETF